MNTCARQLQGIGAVELALAAAGPVSLDELVGWNLARPKELWDWLKAETSRGGIAEGSEAEGGCFSYRDLARRAEVILAAPNDDWRWLVGLEGCVPRILANARAAASERRPKVAERLYRALIRHAAHAAFPGGVDGWLQVVVECVQAFRFAEWLDEAVLVKALAAAETKGDLRLQAILSAARGFVANRLHQVDAARGHLERALAAANALGDRAVSVAVHIQIAYGQIFQGFAHEAIATFERFLGDLPEEILPLPAGLAAPFDPLPEVPLAVLASTYSQVGQYGRGLELLHQLRMAGLRTKRPELAALAQCFLGGNHAGRRELEPARAHAEPAFEFWAASGEGPYFLWHTSLSLAWCRMVEGQFEAARSVLEVGHRARVASGLMYFAGGALLEVLDRLELEGLPPPAGLDIEAEIERALGWNDGYVSAAGHRIRARRLARGEIDDARAAEIELHHGRSIEMLKRSRACPAELARALEDAAGWAARRGRPEEAARLTAEVREIRASLQLDRDGTADSSRLATLVVELGQLAALAERTDGAWGEIAARLCALVGAERCAFVEATAEGPRALAARGGDKAWISTVAALASERDPARPDVVAPPTEHEHREHAAPGPDGVLLIVPFRSAKLGRRGWALLENRYSRALVAPSNRPVLDVLTAQLGVLFENVVVWQELVSARRRLEQENRYYRTSSPPAETTGRIVGKSPALAQALSLVARVAPATTSVLICGETGVGKELFAREIHRLSPRNAGPFIPVHIASLAPGLVASGLFGHERGAFTGATEQVRGRFELADGGTLFLDEVGELGLEDQVRLLRVLQEGTFERVGGTKPLRSDFRLVAATNRDLAAAVKAGQFREDLYFRLAAFPIPVPPLRERKEEIPTLALYFMEAISRKLGVAFEGISEADMARLVEYRWPGNVRELEHVIERAALLSEPPRLSIPPLESAFAGASTPSARTWLTLEEMEKRYLMEVISHTHGRLTGPEGAAQILGLKPSTLNFRIDKLGLRLDVKRARAR